MRIVSARVLALCCSAVIFGNSAADAAVLALKAVKKNGGAIAPTSNLTVVAGDTIEADILVSGWGAELPLGARGVQSALLGVSGFYQCDDEMFCMGANGNILPLGWKGPREPIECPGPNSCVGGTTPGNPCTTNANCLGGGTCTGPSAACLAANPNFPTCTQVYHTCASAGHNPILGAKIDVNRPDYIFNGQSVNLVMDDRTLNYRYFSLIEDRIGIPDTGVPKYVGTLSVQVSNHACGPFEIGFQGGPSSFIQDPSQKNTRVFPTSSPLTLTVSPCNIQLIDCSPGPVLSPSSPEHCDIDARIPHGPQLPFPRLTTNQMVMRYDRSAAGTLSTDYDVALFGPPGLPPPGVTGALVSGNEVTVSLAQRIFPLYWTCIRDKRVDLRCCMASLPADVEDLPPVPPDPPTIVSQFSDVFAILHNLQGVTVPPLPPQRCDIDRSQLCTGADLLMTGDLLVGADGFAHPDNGGAAEPAGTGPYNGDSLPPLCPDQAP